MYDVISFLHLIGAFSQQPTTARPTVFPNSTQMWNIRDMLWSYSTTSQFFNWRIFWHRKGGKYCHKYAPFLFAEHGLNASCLSLNADNCAGQNKNNAMIQVCTCNAIKIIAYFCLFLVPYVEGPDKTKQVDHHLLLTSWPPQIFTRLVLWSS